MSETRFRTRVLWGAALAAVGCFSLMHFVVQLGTFRHSQMMLAAHSAAFSISALACIVIGILQVRRGMHPVERFLDHREEAVRRAQSKAEDLAHGLKTPLAVLAQEA